MHCEQVIRRLIRRCGRVVQFPSGSFLAYLNPIRERTDKLIPTESGIFHQGKWILIASCDKEDEVRGNTVFTAGKEKFLLERVETVYFQNKPAYLWGLAVKAQEESDHE